MTTSSSSPTSPSQNNPPQDYRGRNVLVILFSLGILFVLVGWQFLSIHTTNTDPTVAGQPLSNAQTHLHTVAIGGKAGVLYLGTHYGIFTSTDDATGNILYGLAGQNLEYSQDGGARWTLRKHFPRGDLTALVLDPHHAERLYVGFFLPPQVVYSTDSGKNWQVLTGDHTLP